MRHNLRVMGEDDVVPESDLPSFARQLSERAQNMEGGVEGLYFTKGGTEKAQYWSTVHQAVLEAIRLRTDGTTKHVEKGVATLIMSYAMVEMVGAENWNFNLQNCGTGVRTTAEEFILNGRPTVLLFMHEQATPMGLISLVLRSVGLEESTPFRLHPALDLAIVLVRGGKRDHYAVATEEEDVALRDSGSPHDDTLFVFQNDAWQIPANVVYLADLVELKFVYPETQCSCPAHATRMLVVNQNGMLSYSGDGTEGNSLWVQALGILRYNVGLER